MQLTSMNMKIKERNPKFNEKKITTKPYFFGFLELKTNTKLKNSYFYFTCLKIKMYTNPRSK